MSVIFSHLNGWLFFSLILESMGKLRSRKLLYLENENDDYANVLASIDGFSDGLGIKDLDIDLNEVAHVLKSMRHQFPAQGGSEMASPFKKAANFLCYFVSQQPIKNPFPESSVGSILVQITNHQNSMLGLYIAFDALHEATIKRNDGDITLHNKISLSKHSYVDTVQACAVLTPSSHFHLVSVFLEQMCYRANPEASYKIAF